MTTERLKVVIVGDGGCGKTVLLYAYTKKKFDERYIPTVLDTYLAEVKVADLKVNLEIYDTAGQEDFTQIRTLVYPGTDVFIMCYSCVARATLGNIEKFWYPETIQDQPKTPFLLVGNKLDLASVMPSEYIDPIEAEKMMMKLRGKASIQCSAQQEAVGKAGNVDRVFKTAIKIGLDAKFNPEDDTTKGCVCIVL